MTLFSFLFRSRTSLLFWALPLALGAQPAQTGLSAAQFARHGSHAVDPSLRYYRLICLVHLTGSGKHNDPVRPEFLPPVGTAPSRSGILSWSMQMTDDKNMAILHMVAADRAAFEAILNDKRPEIRVFEVGKQDRDTIEREMKKYKKDFTLDSLRVVAH